MADKIKRDFIVLAGDLVTDVVLHNVADFHRINDASVTMLLRQEEPARTKAKGEKPRRDKDMTDCIALVEGQRDEENRVVLVSQAVHMNEDLYVAKSLLKRRSNFVLHTDLYDGHFYIFSHWVLDLLQEKKYIASIKADLVPHLVRRQFRGAAALPESVREGHEQAGARGVAVAVRRRSTTPRTSCAASPTCCRPTPTASAQTPSRRTRPWTRRSAPGCALSARDPSPTRRHVSAA